MPAAAMPPSAPSRITGIGASTPRPEHQRLQHVVGHAGDEQHHRVQRRRAGAVVAAHPEVGDRRQRDDQRRHLRDAEHEHDHRQHAGQRHAGDEQHDADQDGLDEGDADHALGDGADRRHRQLDEPGAALGADDAREDRPLLASPASPNAMMIAGDDERRDEREHAAADAGHHGQAPPSPGHRSSAAGSRPARAGSCAPEARTRGPSPTTGQFSTPGARWRNLQRVVLDPCTNPRTESPSELSRAAGATRASTPSNAIIVADHPWRPPSGAQATGATGRWRLRGSDARPSASGRARRSGSRARPARRSARPGSTLEQQCGPASLVWRGGCHRRPLIL